MSKEFPTSIEQYQNSEWSRVDHGDGISEYRMTSPQLDREGAAGLRGEIIEALGKPTLERDGKHKLFPCVVGVVGTNQWELRMDAPEDKFRSLFPSAKVISQQPSMARAG